MKQNKKMFFVFVFIFICFLFQGLLLVNKRTALISELGAAGVVVLEAKVFFHVVPG